MSEKTNLESFISELSSFSMSNTDVNNFFTSESIAKELAGVKIANYGPDEAKKIIEDLSKSQDSWGRESLQNRIELVRSFVNLLHAKRTELIDLIVAESGKAYKYAQAEVDYSFTVAEELIKASKVLEDESLIDTPEMKIDVSYQPLGLALLITPWNFPFSLALRKVISAMLAGCVFLLKPPASTSLTAIAIGMALQEAAKGKLVGHVITSSKSASLVTSVFDTGLIKKLSFTGSTEVGQLLQDQAAKGFVRTSLELGGNAPFIVGEHADISKAVKNILNAKFSNSGQACTALNRLYVPSRRREEIIEVLKDELSKLKVGDPRNVDTQVGPLISANAADSIRHLIKTAEEHGATIWKAEQPHSDEERLIAPTLIYGLSPDAEIVRTEIFGPVLTLLEYNDPKDALYQSNDTEYGLAAYIASEDDEEIEYYLHNLEAGMIAVNSGSVSSALSPFGGIKSSGMGRENSTWGLQEFVEPITKIRAE